MGVEVLEQWQRLKVHGMLLERYLGPGKLELLKREVESSKGIPLKTMPRWLINEDRLKEQQETSNKRGLAIVITVSSESEAKRLLTSGLRFGGAVFFFFFFHILGLYATRWVMTDATYIHNPAPYT